MNKQELYRRIEEMPYNHGIFIDTVKLSRRWLLGSISRLEEPTHDGIPALIAKKDAIGDSIVTLIVLCLQLGYDVEECLTIAYNDIKDRKGVMIDDNFVKKTKKR